MASYFDSDDDPTRGSRMLDLPLEDAVAEPDGLTYEPPAGPSPDRRGDTDTAPVAPGRRRWPWVVAFLIALPLAAGAGFWLRPPPPIAGLAPALVDFGPVRLGEAVERVARLDNLGGFPLEVTGAGIRGGEGDVGGGTEFTIGRDGCAGSILEPGASCDVAVTFRPTERGARHASLEVVSGAHNGTSVVALFGEGRAPQVRIEPRRLDFGGRPIGTTGLPQAVAIRNEGTAPLRLEALAVEGLAAGDFAVGIDGCGQRTLAPREQCRIEVFFEPEGEGDRNATLWIRGDAPEDLPPVVLSGRGGAREPLLSLETERVDFGARAVAEASEDAAFTVRNDGTGDLVLDRIAVDEPGLDAGFSVIGDGCTEAPVQPGGSCVLTVSFVPVTQGAATGTLRLRAFGEDDPRLVVLEGIGLAPAIRVTPLRVALGEVPVGRTSRAVSIELRNSGLAPLRITSIRLVGADRRIFRSSDDGCAGEAVEAGEACTVRVTASPRRAGPHAAEVEIEHNAGPVERIPVTALGLSARLSVEPTRLDFGGVTLETRRDASLTLANRGRTTLRIERVELGGSDRSAWGLLAPGCGSRSLAPGETCAVRLRFEPPREGSHQAQVRIVHDGAGGAETIPLAGSGLPRPRPRFAYDPVTIEFAGRAPGTSSDVATVTLRNDGTGSLTVVGWRIAGEHPGDFRLVPGSCGPDGTSLPGGSTCTVGVRFAPQNIGRRSGALIVRHDAGPARAIELAGDGLSPQ